LQNCTDEHHERAEKKCGTASKFVASNGAKWQSDKLSHILDGIQSEFISPMILLE